MGADRAEGAQRRPVLADRDGRRHARDMRPPALRPAFRRARRAATLAAVTIAAVAAGCTPIDGEGVTEPLLSAETVAVSADRAVIRIGDTAQVQAWIRVGGVMGAFFPVGTIRDPRWSVSDSTVARLIVVPPTPGDSFPIARARLVGRRRGLVDVIVRSGSGRSGGTATLAVDGG